MMGLTSAQNRQQTYAVPGFYETIFQLTSAVSDYHENFLFMYTSEDDPETCSHAHVIFHFVSFVLSSNFF